MMASVVCARDFLRAEGPATNNRHPHDPEIIGRDEVNFSGRLLPRFRFRGASDVKSAVPFLVSKGMLAPMAAASTPGSPRTRSSRRLKKLGPYPRPKRDCPSRSARSAPWSTRSVRQDVVRIEIDRRPLRVPETFQSQPAPANRTTANATWVMTSADRARCRADRRCRRVSRSCNTPRAPPCARFSTPAKCLREYRR